MSAIENYPFIPNHYNDDKPELGISLKLNYKKYIDIAEIKKDITLSDDKNGLELLDSEEEKEAKAKKMALIKSRFTRFLDLLIK